MNPLGLAGVLAALALILATMFAVAIIIISALGLMVVVATIAVGATAFAEVATDVAIWAARRINRRAGDITALD